MSNARELSQLPRGIDVDSSGNVLPITNNTQNLGSSGNKWANAYATTFVGALSGNATTATTATNQSGGTVNATTGTFSSLITGANSASTDVNTANDTGSISIRGSSTTIASMSFHRTGAYAINMGVGTDNVFRIGGWSASNNCLQLTSSGNLSILGDVSFNSGYGSSAVAYGCRAWVNFNGTGTVAIRASGNVSSITDNGTGHYRVNFTNALPDANYSVVAGAAKQDTNNDGNIKAQVNGFNNGASNANSTTGTTVMVGPSTLASTTDSGVVTVAVFR